MQTADNPSKPSNPVDSMPVDSASGSEDSYYPDLDEQSTSPGSHPWSASDGTTIVDMNAIHTRPAKCPRLHWYSFKGDLLGILTCITEHDDLSQTMTLVNDKQQPIQGVTALYIAAQHGYLDICKLLVENGADPGSACYINSTGESFTPVQIAQGYGRYRTWWYLKRQQEGRNSVATFLRKVSCTAA